MQNKFKYPLILLATLLIIGLTIFTFQSREPSPLKFDASMGIPVMSPAIALPQVSLIDQDNQTFTQQNLKGKWSLLFFGYTNCPDICPTTLQTMGQVADKLGDYDINYLFITVDPKRDTVAVIKEYVGFFHADFMGITGDKTEIDRLAETLGIVYNYDGDLNDDQYTVSHYGAILVIDPEARLRAHILPPHPVKKVSTAVETIIEYYGTN